MRSEKSSPSRTWRYEIEKKTIARQEKAWVKAQRTD